jgi:hypothetical protein
VASRLGLHPVPDSFQFLHLIAVDLVVFIKVVVQVAELLLDSFFGFDQVL